MTNKDWINRVLRHADDVPVPYNLPLSPPARGKLEQFYGTDDVEQFLDLPIRMAGPKSVKPLYASPAEYGSRATDEFGVVWSTSEIDRGAPVGPCITVPELAGYRFPDPAAPYRFEHLDEWCRQNARHFTILAVGDLWERATFMTMHILSERFVFDGIFLSDDYGTQKSMLISPGTWRQLVKPRLARIFAKAKSAGKAVMLHSCGNVRAVVGDLVALGLDILHPIQPGAMDILALKREFGSRLTFCGGLGTQDLLINAGPNEIRSEVHRLKRRMGRGGGYILEPGITIQADVPLENILAMIDAASSEHGCGPS